ncbi:MAG: HlyC/CorC family transporter [Gemmatimonadales bacterium]|nr:HlyC/CorC family transporter [Gemmatimonadales bacterium]
MTEFLQSWVAPVAAVILTLWAAWVAVAAESDEDLPRALEGRMPTGGGTLPLARALHVVHLSLLVLAGVAAGAAVSWWAWSSMGQLIRLGLVVGLVWVIGDLLPRALAAIEPGLTSPARRMAVRTLPPFAPLFRLVEWADTNRRAGDRQAEQRHLVAAEREMLMGVFSLAEKTVLEVMTPRIDIVAVDKSDTFDAVVTSFRSAEHSRLLVLDGNPDDVVGVVYAKDLLATLSQSVDAREHWTSLIRPAVFVPEGKSLDRQLHDFQRGPRHLAVVVDEYGGTAGIVTLEDILEEVVGEIRDEYDTDEVAPIQEVGDGSLAVQGGVALAELEAVLEHSFGREDVSTVGGLVFAEFGRVPRTGESVVLPGYALHVEQMIGRRVKWVRLHPVPPTAEPEASTAREHRQ